MHGEGASAAGHADYPKSNSCPETTSNKDLRTREHLTEAEVERLIKATGDNRHGHWDRLITETSGPKVRRVNTAWIDQGRSNQRSIVAVRRIFFCRRSTP
jgi:hypothetical protein